MSVRPFYIEASIDGRKTDLAGGTKRKDGRHSIAIHQRDEGCITTPFKIEQYSMINTETGTHHLYTDVYYKGDLIKTHITNY